MLVTETISHSMCFSWKVYASHFIIILGFLNPREWVNGWDKNNSSESRVLPLPLAFKYPHLLIFKKPSYVYLTLPAIPQPQLHFSEGLHPLHWFSHFPSSPIRLLRQNSVEIGKVTHHLFVTKPSRKISIFIYSQKLSRIPIASWALF